MDIEEHDQVFEEEQIMILIDDLEDNEEDQDLMTQLVAEPVITKQPSFTYDYKPAPVLTPHFEQPESGDLKVSNRSTSTCADTETLVRRCFCSKTGCRKNYCQCFKMGVACSSDCECIACRNRDRLFLTKSDRGVTKCKCQKSHCLKKYCQCHSSGKKCGPACKCLQCQNIEEAMQEEIPEVKPESQGIDHHLFLNI